MKLPATRLHNKRNLYEARIQIEGVRTSAYGKTIQEAERNLEEKILQSARLQRDSWSFKQFAGERYKPTIAMLSEAYNQQYEWAMSHLKPLHHRDIASLKRPELQAFITRIGKGMSRSSTAHILKFLKGILNLAEIDEVVPSNAARHVKLPRIVKSEKWIPDLGDINRIANSTLAKAYQAYPVIMLAACMGLRIGEIQRLEPKHFRKKGILIVPGTKSESAARELPLPSTLLDAIKGYRFPLAPQSTSSARKGIRRIDERLTPHLLRHFCNTALQELGCPPELRRRILGHREPGVNAIYSHSKQIELTREWLDKLASLVFQQTEVNAKAGY